jgi:hypothetical protein
MPFPNVSFPTVSFPNASSAERMRHRDIGAPSTLGAAKPRGAAGVVDPRDGGRALDGAAPPIYHPCVPF